MKGDERPTTDAGHRALGRDFLAALLLLSGVAGLYVGAVAIDAVEIFWVVVSLSAGFALVKRYGRRTIDFVVRARKYPALLKLSADLQAQRETLKTRLVRLEEKVARAHSDGVTEGRRQVIGAGLASSCPDVDVTGATVFEDQVALLGKGRGRSIQLGARYAVETGVTRKRLGVVEAVHHDPVRNHTVLRCVHIGQEQFWTDLAARVEFNDSAPENAVLTPLSLADFTSVGSERASDIPEEQL